ncbi:Copper chaperone CopZ [Actinokineospora alba]|uniref:Copper chaperone CopZ n=1 Tax=Actinokineospora alba TaxID=504798 RepID=A0A1H0PIF8_9PSEU|nr:heavy-metal-associated domain-containing protein [Actinokineospora alba]TDP65798.1 copper chaperone CopZ [Actinokineospora alba]SDI64822.1 Copper chaperone CopZ [Actinokineospora alba]SDP04445.1 Copper chaperone CopZ [Actinokineospora alba]
MSVQTVYTVTGMTCGHCASSVTEELTGIEGVTDVAVDLASGAVTVTSATTLERDAVVTAVTEAGYQVTA